MSILATHSAMTADRPALTRRMPDLGTGALGMAAYCVLAFMYAPIVTLIVFSFNKIFLAIMTRILMIIYY